MKTRSRKATDDVLEMTGVEETIGTVSNEIVMLPTESIKPFRNPVFRLYDGERLKDMVESVKEHGILTPVIVWEIDGGYEMLAGHSRQHAAGMTGIKEIPAIVKKNLTEEEAYVYVIESNVMQRSFAELLPSEKGAVLALRYEKVFCQGKRKAIMKEIAKLNGTGTNAACGHDVHKSKSRDAIGEDYGMTGRNIARYLRVNKLSQGLKDLMDQGKIPLVSAVEISYLNIQEQKMLEELMREGKKKLSTAVAAMLHDKAGKLDRDKILELLGGKKAVPKTDTRMFNQIKKKYFKNESSEQVADIIDQALQAWFLGKEKKDV